MNSVFGLLGRIARFGVHVAAWLLVATMLAIVFNAGLRYLFGGGIDLVIELAGYIFTWLIFLSIAGTFLAGGHVTVELLTENLPERARRILYRYVVPPICIVYVAMIGWAGGRETWSLFQSGEVSIGFNPFLLWPMLMIVPIGCTLLVIALVAILFGYKTEDKSPDAQQAVV